VLSASWSVPHADAEESSALRRARSDVVEAVAAAFVRDAAVSFLLAEVLSRG
tara:strand:- start:195 stop:350 length:156 start_codon:yes stop_codon:yes gene_type:complete